MIRENNEALRETINKRRSETDYLKIKEEVERLEVLFAPKSGRCKVMHGSFHA